MTSEQTPVFRSGFVALVGRPNAGKSTLINALVGEKVAIVSDRAQTTRHRLRAVLDRPAAQLVLVDTPGLHKPHDVLGEEVNRATYKALEDVDVIAFLIDASTSVGKGDAWVAELIKKVQRKTPVVLVLTKLDLVDPEQMGAQRKRAAALGEAAALCELSAVAGAGLERFITTIESLLPEGPRWFPEDLTTDQPLEVMIAEFIREKALRATFDEVPHALGVSVDEFSVDERRNLTRIFATIYTEHDSQKGIIIGAGGAGIKRIGAEARTDLEHLLGTRVFLDVRVKVKKNWRRDLSQIRRFGYGEGI